MIFWTWAVQPYSGPYRRVHILARVSQGSFCCLARVWVNSVVLSWCPRCAATKYVHACHAVINRAKGPWLDLLMLCPVIVYIFVLLSQNIVWTHIEERCKLCHHPCKRYVCYLLVIVAPSDIAVHTGEPDLTEGLARECN